LRRAKNFLKIPDFSLDLLSSIGDNIYSGVEIKNQKRKDEKMKKTYTITRGNQYDGQDGYSIECDGLESWGSIGPRMDGTVGITCDGRLSIRNDEVADAIRQTLADGQMRQVTVGTDAPARPRLIDPTPDPRLCPHCGSVCYGDCQAARD
jgi:hypothetical protein